jgi:hypothetical protein
VGCIGHSADMLRICDKTQQSLKAGIFAGMALDKNTEKLIK